MKYDTCIIAMGGGGVNAQPYDASMATYIRDLLQKDQPRICFVPTARGDQAADIVSFYSYFQPGPWRPSHLALFTRTVTDIAAFLQEQDVIYVGGGNTANMLAVWHTQGVDVAIQQAWQAGVMLCGWSAGGLVWFGGGTTNSFGQDDPHALNAGLGLLPGSFCPHFDTQPKRQPLYRRLVAEGTLPAGYAVDDSAALCFSGAELVEAVAWKPGTGAARIEKGPDGLVETPIVTRYIGA